MIKSVKNFNESLLYFFTVNNGLGYTGMDCIGITCKITF